MMLHENRLPGDDSHEILLHALFVILKKRQNLKLSSAANYRWRFKDSTVWIQITTDFLLVLMRVQSVNKGYQQMTKVVDS